MESTSINHVDISLEDAAASPSSGLLATAREVGSAAVLGAGTIGANHNEIVMADHGEITLQPPTA
ncbi:hypothetical protein ACIQZO_22170 [Streptomyces sp. NPDC097617]|uniref:hypothetical protein n=1 Tax=Streptomyces sp. NPDC097617 TaxID=3366091 RepID=UPI003830E9D0